MKRPADRGSFTRTRVKRPADRGSFTRTRVKRPADRGSFPPAESLNLSLRPNFRSRLGPCQHCNDGRFRPADRGSFTRTNTCSAVAFALESPSPRRSTADRNSVTCRPTPNPSTNSVPRSDWTTSATRFTESKHGRVCDRLGRCPGQNAFGCAADRPIEDFHLGRIFHSARVKRPADRGSFTRPGFADHSLGQE